jgi:hypothetical protein
VNLLQSCDFLSIMLDLAARKTSFHWVGTIDSAALWIASYQIHFSNLALKKKEDVIELTYSNIMPCPCRDAGTSLPARQAAFR